MARMSFGNGSFGSNKRRLEREAATTRPVEPKPRPRPDEGDRDKVAAYGARMRNR